MRGRRQAKRALDDQLPLGPEECTGAPSRWRGPASGGTIVVKNRRQRSLAEEDAAAWRDPWQVASQWLGVPAVDPDRLRYRATGRWWEVLAASGLTLLVTREYEHLVMAIGTAADAPSLSYLVAAASIGSGVRSGTRRRPRRQHAESEPDLRSAAGHRLDAASGRPSP